MLVTNTITMSIDRQQNSPVIDAVQGDANSRAIKIKLTSGGQPWTVPSGASCLIRFGKPDKTGGIYDTLEDGTSAIEWGDGYLQFILASQVLTCPGMVMLQVEINHENTSIATFVIMIRVHEDPSVGTMDSKDYINLSAYVAKEISKNLSGLDISGGVCYVTVTQETGNAMATTDKVYNDIKLAYDAGKVIICTVNDANGAAIGTAPMRYYTFGNPDIFFVEGFSCCVSGVQDGAAKDMACIATAEITSADYLNQCVVSVATMVKESDLMGYIKTDDLSEAIDTALSQAKESGEFDGPQGPKGDKGAPLTVKEVYQNDMSGGYNTIVLSDGTDVQIRNGEKGDTGPQGPAGAEGFSPTILVTKIEGGHRITITDAHSVQTVDVMDGVGNTESGESGADGRGIVSVVRTSGNGAAGTTDTYTITYTDNTTSTFTVYNGKDGKSAYIYAKDGGYTGTEDEFSKKLSETTVSVEPQELTEEQKAQARKNIGVIGVSLTKSEFSALNSEDITKYYNSGVRLIVAEDGYTNLIPKSTDSAGNVYRGCGYRNGYRLTSSGDMAASDNCCVSGFMPYTHGSTIRIVGSCGDALSNAGQYIGLYGENYDMIKIEYASSVKATWEPRADGLWEMTIDTSKMTAWSIAKYFRVSCSMCVGADLVVTVNEPIGLEV